MVRSAAFKAAAAKHEVTATLTRCHSGLFCTSDQSELLTAKLHLVTLNQTRFWGNHAFSVFISRKVFTTFKKKKNCRNGAISWRSKWTLFTLEKRSIISKNQCQSSSNTTLIYTVIVWKVVFETKCCFGS